MIQIYVNHPKLYSFIIQIKLIICHINLLFTVCQVSNFGNQKDWVLSTASHITMHISENSMIMVYSVRRQRYQILILPPMVGLFAVEGSHFDLPVIKTSLRRF